MENSLSVEQLIDGPALVVANQVSDFEQKW